MPVSQSTDLLFDGLARLAQFAFVDARNRHRQGGHRALDVVLVQRLRALAFGTQQLQVHSGYAVALLLNFLSLRGDHLEQKTKLVA